MIPYFVVGNGNYTEKVDEYKKHHQKQENLERIKLKKIFRAIVKAPRYEQKYYNRNFGQINPYFGAKEQFEFHYCYS